MNNSVLMRFMVLGMLFGGAVVARSIPNNKIANDKAHIMTLDTLPTLGVFYKANSVTYNVTNKTMTFSGAVTFRNERVEVKADSVIYDIRKKSGTAKGHIFINSVKIDRELTIFQ